MKGKLFLFLFLFIISIFGNLREEAKERQHIYTLIKSEIKEKESEIKVKYAVLSLQNRQKTENIKRERLQSSGYIVISLKLPPIIKVNFTKKIFHKKYKSSFFYTILRRSPKRVLRI